jgi:translation initiation factor 1
MAKRDRIRSEPDARLNRPFAGLASRLGAGGPPAEAPEGSEASTAAFEAAAHLAAKPARAAAGTAAPRELPRAVVRLERKGRGGKEATVVEKLALAPAELERWLKELKQALGCGGAVEGAALVLQGDLRARVKPLLEERGVRKVTVG